MGKVCPVVTIITFMITAAIGLYFVISTKNGYSNAASIQERDPRLLLKTDYDKIQLFDCKSRKIENILRNQSNGIASFASLYDKTIFHGSRKQNEPILQTSVTTLATTYSDITQLAEGWTKSAMVVDPITEKLYVLDGIAKKVYLADLQSKYYSVVVSDLEDPKDIAYDPKHGNLFVLQSSSILRIDVNQRRDQMKHPNLRAFTIDYSRRVVYYSDELQVMSYDFDHRIEQLSFNLTNVTSLAFANNSLFFIQSTFEFNLQNKTLKSCNLDQRTWKNGICVVEELYSDPHLEEVKFYREDPLDVVNDCTSTQCDHMCLNRYSICGCTEGWESIDRKCVPKDNLYVNVDNTAITKYKFDQQNVSEILLKSDWGIRAFRPFRNDKFFYTTEKPGERILSSDNSYYNLGQRPVEWTATGFAYVDNTNVLYVADEARGLIGVNRVDQSKREYNKVLLSNLDKPRDVVVDPESGLMFVLQASSILEANMDGTNVRTLYKHPVLSAIALDPRNKKLYIALSNTIICKDYRMNRRYQVTDLNNTTVISLAVVSGDLFALTEKDFLKKSIQKCRLSDGVETCRLTSIYKNDLLVDIKSHVKHEEKLKTACSKNNSECQHFCLLRSRDERYIESYSCACDGIGWKSNDDGKTCRPTR